MQYELSYIYYDCHIFVDLPYVHRKSECPSSGEKEVVKIRDLKGCLKDCHGSATLTTSVDHFVVNFEFMNCYFILNIVH